MGKRPRQRQKLVFWKKVDGHSVCKYLQHVLYTFLIDVFLHHRCRSTRLCLHWLVQWWRLVYRRLQPSMRSQMLLSSHWLWAYFCLLTPSVLVLSYYYFGLYWPVWTSPLFSPLSRKCMGELGWDIVLIHYPSLIHTIFQILHIGNLLTMGLSLGCAFAPTTGALIAFRFLCMLISPGFFLKNSNTWMQLVYRGVHR